jgi:hypothetical protein
MVDYNPNPNLECMFNSFKKHYKKIHEEKIMTNIIAPKNNVSEDKFQPSLLPMDIIVPMLEPAYREGIIKYKRESWRLGFKSTVMYDALRRHLDKWFYELESFDPEPLTKHNLGAAMFCLINLYNTEHSYPELDDRPLKILEEYKHGI